MRGFGDRGPRCARQRKCSRSLVSFGRSGAGVMCEGFLEAGFLTHLHAGMQIGRRCLPYAPVGAPVALRVASPGRSSRSGGADARGVKIFRSGEQIFTGSCLTGSRVN